MTKIAIIRSGSEGIEMAKMLAETAKDRGIEIVVSNIGFNNPFEVEPILIDNTYLKFKEMERSEDFIFYDKPKSKYHK